jgi:predicted metal-binding protein
MDKVEINKKIKSFGFTDFKWIEASDIVVANWVRVKCMFGCTSYGTKASCPPQMPSVQECKDFFAEYHRAVLFHIRKQLDNPDDRLKWGKEVNSELIKLERDIFLDGYYKAFVLYMDECHLCYECALSRSECHHKKESRPCAEALAVDVYATAHKYNYPVEVLKDYYSEMNRYAILLID